jgi:hypothetical protein
MKTYKDVTCVVSRIVDKSIQNGKRRRERERERERERGKEALVNGEGSLNSKNICKRN